MLYANYAAETKMPVRGQLALLSVMINSSYAVWDIKLSAQLGKPGRKCQRC